MSDFESDDTMRDINFEDIKSSETGELSGSSIETVSNICSVAGNKNKKKKKRKEQSVSANLMQEANNHTTALEHYKKIKRKNIVSSARRGSCF